MKIVQRTYRRKVARVLEQLEKLYVLLKHENFREFTIAYKQVHDLECFYQVAVRLYEMGFSSVGGFKPRLMLIRGLTRRDYYSGQKLLKVIQDIEDRDSDTEPSDKEE